MPADKNTDLYQLLVGLVAFLGSLFVIVIGAVVKYLFSMVKDLFKRTDDINDRMTTIEVEHRNNCERRRNPR